ncbi:MAG: hypothetical protein D4R92_02680 [Actinobacteria bacterium]|nr:MAG: hypothetical protein D4R92_02680 [Actinomycetota bacterium]
MGIDSHAGGKPIECQIASSSITVATTTGIQKVEQYVMSANHNLFGESAVKLRLTRFGGRTAVLLAWVQHTLTLRALCCYA